MRVMWKLLDREGHTRSTGEDPVLDNGKMLSVVFDDDVTANEGDKLILHYVGDPDDRRSPGD